MQKVMQSDCAVFRTEASLAEGQKRMSAVWAKRPQLGVSDRSLVWNSDLVETLELDNLMAQAIATVDCAANRKGSPWRPCSRRFRRT